MALAAFAELECTSKCRISQITYKWTVENFSMCYHKTGAPPVPRVGGGGGGGGAGGGGGGGAEPLTSTVFAVSDADPIRWRLKLFPNCNSGHLSLHLEQVAAIDSEIKAMCQFSVHNGTGEKVHASGPLVKQGKQYLTIEWNQFTNRAKIEENKSQWLPDDTLTILCELQVTDFVRAVQRSQTFQSQRLDQPVVEGLGLMLNSKSFSDVSFTVGQREFRAHRVVLAARSPVLAALFHNKLNRVDIDGAISADVFEELLRFIYTGHVDQLEVVARDLLPIAVKFKVEALQRLCEEELARQLDVDNVCALLTLADASAARLLKRAAIDFINANFAHVCHTPGWFVMAQSQPQLVPEIYQDMMT